MNKKESRWFQGLKYAEYVFKSYDTYLDGLFALETDLYYIGFSTKEYNQGIRDYYHHVKKNPDIFMNNAVCIN